MPHFQSLKARWNQALAHPSAAIVFALVAFLAYTFMDAGGQELMLRGMPSGEVVLGRMGINLVLCFAYYLFTEPRAIRPLFIPSQSTALFWSRAFAGSTALACGYAALSYLALSEFLTALHLNPFPTAFLCYMFLGEKSSKKQIIASIISFGGILLVLQPEFIFHNQPMAIGVVPERVAEGRTTGVILTFSCMALAATELTLYRKLGDTYDAAAMLFAYVFAGTIVSIPWIIISGEGFLIDISASMGGLLVLITACGICAQICIILAVKRAPGTFIAVMGYFQIVFAAVVQMVVFGQPPNLVEIGGMAIIIVAGAWCMLERVGKDNKDSDEAGAMSMSATTRADGYQLLRSEDLDTPTTSQLPRSAV